MENPHQNEATSNIIITIKNVICMTEIIHLRCVLLIEHVRLHFNHGEVIW